MSAPRLLDLFCCAGGAAMGYHRAGFEVVGVDIAPQPNYPFEFRQGDALEFVRQHGREFDAVHASPPCQAHLNLGAVNRALGRAYDHADLIADTRAALDLTGLPYLIENVADARKKLIDPVRICGTSFGLPLRRHRLFEATFPIRGTACEHERFTEPRYWTGWRPKGERRLSTVVQVYGNAGGNSEWPAAMGIDWMTNKELAEAIPPAYTEHIGVQLMAHIEGRVGRMTTPEHACVVCTECESCRRRICPDPTQETAIHTDCGWMCGFCVEPDADFLRDQEREREIR